MLERSVWHAFHSFHYVLSISCLVYVFRGFMSLSSFANLRFVNHDFAHHISSRESNVVAAVPVLRVAGNQAKTTLFPSIAIDFGAVLKKQQS